MWNAWMCIYIYMLNEIVWMTLALASADGRTCAWEHRTNRAPTTTSEKLCAPFVVLFLHFYVPFLIFNIYLLTENAIYITLCYFSKIRTQKRHHLLWSGYELKKKMFSWVCWDNLHGSSYLEPWWLWHEEKSLSWTKCCNSLTAEGMFCIRMVH